MSLRFYLLLTILFALLAACTTQQATTPPPSPVPTEVSVDKSDPAYPAPEEFQAAYPVERESDEPYFITEIPAPAAGRVTITGILKSGYGEPQPAERVLLALASIVVSGDGIPQLAGYDRVAAPKTLTDSAGRFVFQDVAPSNYALVVDRINEAFLLNDPETGGDFIFEGVAGEILDLGELVHPELPGYD